MRHERMAQTGLGVDLVRCDEDGAHRQERVGALGAQPLAVALLAGLEGCRGALPVASADVVDHDVAGDVVHRVVDGDATCPPADDHAELDLEIQGLRALVPDDRLAVGDDRIGELGEEQGSLGDGAAALGDVLRVVETDAHDLARVREGRGRRPPVGSIGLAPRFVARAAALDTRRCHPLSNASRESMPRCVVGSPSPPSRSRARPVSSRSSTSTPKRSSPNRSR